LIQTVIVIFLIIIALLGLVLYRYHNQQFMIFDLTENTRLGHILLIAGILLIITAVCGLLILLLLPVIWTLITVIIASLIAGFVGICFATNL